MSDAGRKRWWRAALVAVLGGGTILGGWVGLSRSATPESPVLPAVPAKAADEAWMRPAPPAPTTTPVAPARESTPAVPAPAGLPVIPAIPVIPDAAPNGVTPVSLPAIPVIATVPAAPPELPVASSSSGYGRKEDCRAHGRARDTSLTSAINREPNATDCGDRPTAVTRKALATGPVARDRCRGFALARPEHREYCQNGEVGYRFGPGRARCAGGAAGPGFVSSGAARTPRSCISRRDAWIARGSSEAG